MAALFGVGMAEAQNNECDNPGEAPDIIVGSIFDKNRYGTVAGITAFSLGAESCNIGTCWANWIQSTPDHPVIAQNLFRLKDGRFMQIGQSWLKHSFQALNGGLCTPGCIPTAGQHLGVNCSDPYHAGYNGSQHNLGPKFEVDATTGTHLHPFTDQGMTGDAIYKRLQVHNVDLDPALNVGAEYFAEIQYVAADDAMAGNNSNNNSYRQVLVTETGGEFDFSLTGSTFQQLPAIVAWADEPGVAVASIPTGFVGGHSVRDLGGGVWRYDYALQNLIAHDSAQALVVPLPHGVQVTNVGFHDVDYHSGEPYDGTDWSFTIDTASSPNTITWSTQSYDDNPDANALRWGTLYNFWFDADVAPAGARLTILPFRPAGQLRIWTSAAPDRCGDAFCDVDENDVACSVDCAFLGDAGEVPTDMTMAKEAAGDVSLDWNDSCLGGDANYEIYEGVIGDYASHVAMQCTTGGLTSATVTPASGSRYYLIVPNNGFREGSYGSDTAGERPQGFPACMSLSVGACP